MLKIISVVKTKKNIFAHIVPLLIEFEVSHFPQSINCTRQNVKNVILFLTGNERSHVCKACLIFRRICLPRKLFIQHWNTPRSRKYPSSIVSKPAEYRRAKNAARWLLASSRTDHVRSTLSSWVSCPHCPSAFHSLPWRATHRAYARISIWNANFTQLYK